MRLLLDAAVWSPRRQDTGRQNKGRSRGLSLFVLQAGGCDGCASEFDTLRYGVFGGEGDAIRFVDTPCDADLLLVTGCLTRPMVAWVHEIWQAMPNPKGLALVGACALGEWPFLSDYAVNGGSAEDAFDGMIRCDMSLRGCPPAPEEILHALRRLAAGQVVS
nr:NADH-quinone oxidoreductase subunit B [Acidomonas methanolica]